MTTDPLPAPDALRTAADRLVSALAAHADPGIRLELRNPLCGPQVVVASR